MGLLAWLVTAVQETTSRLILVEVVAGAIGLLHLPHSIAGNVGVLFGLFISPAISMVDYVGFLVLATVGNAFGGTIFVAVMSSSLVVLLSALGIPASFVVIATLSIAGLGSGRASRTFTVEEAIRGDVAGSVSVDALAEGAGSPTVIAPSREAPTDELAAVGHADVDAGAENGDSLFDPEMTVG